MLLDPERSAPGMVNRGFVLSDHVDWPSLLAAVEAIGAERVWVTHGTRMRWCAGCARSGGWTRRRWLPGSRGSADLDPDAAEEDA